MTDKHEAMSQALSALRCLQRAFFKRASSPEEIAQGCDRGFEDFEAEWVVPAMQAIESLQTTLAQTAHQSDSHDDLKPPEPDTHCWDDDNGEDCWSHSRSQILAYGDARDRAGYLRGLEEGRQQSALIDLLCR